MFSKVIVAAASSLLFATCTSFAACPINATKKLESVIASKPEFRETANAQVVRDLRTLRDAAVILDAYHQDRACQQVTAALNTLTASPERTLSAGDNDEAKANKIEESRRPKKAKP
ncbi:MAG: photosystem reaction center subunit H [Beijerinckiaceae bacterium]|nr:photosystem reaction center subunit H [Beijerinckiaceae bacterium]